MLRCDAFGAIAGVLWRSSAPGFIAVFMGVFALLPVLTLSALWNGGGERIWIERDNVCVQRGYGSPRRVARSGIQSIEANKNAGVGAQQFYRIVARLRPRREGRLPPRVPLASLVRGEEAASEVMAWIEERLAA